MAKTERPAVDLAALGNAAGKTHNPVDVLKHRKQGTSKGRDGRVQVTGWFDPSYRATMKMLAAREGTTLESLMQEAMDMLFVKHKIDRVEVNK